MSDQEHSPYWLAPEVAKRIVAQKAHNAWVEAIVLGRHDDWAGAAAALERLDAIKDKLH